MRLGTEGSVKGHGGLGSSRIGQAMGWSVLAEVPFQGLNLAAALVLCAWARGSELLAHDGYRGVVFPIPKAFRAL